MFVSHDVRIAAAPLFPNLCCFPEGRHFKQWTGNDSKALMKVYLPAIVGHVPQAMVRAIASFIDFCYIVWHSVINENHLDKLDELLATFHEEQEVFCTEGIWTNGFNLPRQHSLTHYKSLIRLFGAPNGLCTSITKSRHIMAVKKPWWCSNKHNALGLILQTNQRLSQLAAARADFEAQGMLPVSHPSQSTPQG